jgi:hypothetical protein
MNEWLGGVGVGEGGEPESEEGERGWGEVRVELGKVSNKGVGEQAKGNKGRADKGRGRTSCAEPLPGSLIADKGPLSCPPRLTEANKDY